MQSHELFELLMGGKRETIAEAWARDPNCLTDVDLGVMVEKLESMDPDFFRDYPTKHGGQPTRQEKLEAVREGLAYRLGN
jgi:hypothetical protein